MTEDTEAVVETKSMSLQELLENIDKKLTISIQLLIANQQILEQYIKEKSALWTPPKEQLINVQ